MQFVEVELDPGEAAIGEAGSMMFMDAGIAMDTVFGDGSAQQGGFFGKLLGRRQAADHRRVAVHDGLSPTSEHGKQRVAFAAPYPGKILAMDLHRLGGTLICQKDAFLCAARGVSARHRVPAQARRSASSAARASSCRSSTATASPSCTPAAPCSSASCSPARRCSSTPAASSAYTPSIDFEIQYVGKIKTALFGGEGLFFAKVTGPGTVWLQSLPFSRLASRVFAAAPQTGGGGARRGLGAAAASAPAACSAACSVATTSDSAAWPHP